MRTFNDAVYAVRESLESERPDNENDAVEVGQQAIHYLIDCALTYTADILEYWDGSTHPATYAGEGELDLMDLVTQSVALDLAEQSNDAMYDGNDEWIESKLDGVDLVAYELSEDSSRDDLLDLIHNGFTVTKTGPSGYGIEYTYFPTTGELKWSLVDVGLVSAITVTPERWASILALPDYSGE